MAGALPPERHLLAALLVSPLLLSPQSDALEGELGMPAGFVFEVIWPALL